MKTAYFRLFFITLLGFASGLPLALTGQAMQAWLTVEGIDLSTIGFLALVGLPYTFKFLWAPLLDRFDIPWFGRRQGWLLLIQVALALVLWLLSLTVPSQNIGIFAAYAVLLAFLSASQDVMIDAYRTDILPAAERGMGASLGVLGYRLAMILSGGIALIWSDPLQGGKSWNEIYQIMAWIMVILAVASLLLMPRLQRVVTQWEGSARNDILGLLAIVAITAIGYLVTTKGFTPLFTALLAPWFTVTPEALPEVAKKIMQAHKRWSDIAALFLGLAVTLPAAGWAMRRVGFITLNNALDNFWQRPHALALLLLIIAYKLGDAFAGSLLTPFLLSGAGFSAAEVGVVNKILGIWLTIIGAIVGGALMWRLGLYRSLLTFGVLQLISNLGFYLISLSSKGAWGSITLPEFDLFIVTLKTSTEVDFLLLAAVTFENISGGMGTAAFVALLMALCHAKFTATQYALLSAFAAVGRVWVSPLAGAIAESSGWPVFFLLSLLFALPGIYLLWRLRTTLRLLDRSGEAAAST